jgi:chromosome segregation ATPase
MTFEEMQHTIQFILEHQSRLTTGLEVLTEKVDKLSDAHTKSEARSVRIEQSNALLLEMISRHDERLDSFSEQQAQLSEQQAQLIEAQRKSEARSVRVEETVALLIEVIRRHNERLDTLSENVETLVEAQKETGERLNALINTVERYIDGGRNGRS